MRKNKLILKFYTNPTNCPALYDLCHQRKNTYENRLRTQEDSEYN